MNSILHSTISFSLFKDAHLIRNVRGYIELATQKAGVYFTTVKLRDLSTQFTELSNNYESLQSNLVKEIITICGRFKSYL